MWGPRGPLGAAAAYLAHAGVHLLLWLRHIEAHAYIPRSALVDAGLRVGVVERVVDAAVLAWKRAGNSVAAAGLPELPICGPLAPSSSPWAACASGAVPPCALHCGPLSSPCC